MSEMRVALYVYEKADIVIAPQQAIDFFSMVEDYSARFERSIVEPTKLVLEPGVYGFFFVDKHGVEAGPDVKLVVDLQRKKPWPAPPPPPPPPYANRGDWKEHTIAFMGPLGVDAEAGG